MFRLKRETLKTDWWPIEFHSDFTNQGTWISAIMREGDTVTLDGIFKLTTGNLVPSTTYSNFIPVLPLWLRPRQTFYSQMLTGASALHTGTIVAYVSGNVEYRHNTGDSAYMSFGGLTWPADPLN